MLTKHKKISFSKGPGEWASCPEQWPSCLEQWAS